MCGEALRQGSEATDGAPVASQVESTPGEEPHRRAVLKDMSTPCGAIPDWVEQRDEQQLLEMATSVLALRTIKHLPRNLRQMTWAIPKKLLQHHTHSHHQWGQEAR